jgi:hypothetical protein
MDIKVIYHFMPWEIDYALLTFTQLKKSKYYLSKDINITIDSVLNLSSYVIDWEKSPLSKDFFIKKYDALSLLLKDYNHNKKVYKGNNLYGHLDNHRESVGEEFDYYIAIAPDMYFSEHLLYYLCESVKNIKNDYFVLTPQISKLWDSTWDEITDPNYLNIDYNNWDKVDTFDIRYNLKNQDQDINLYPTKNNKWAGWFDLYSKAFYEDLAPIHQDWRGYGPWDWYSMMLSQYAKQNGVDFQQYLLKGQTIFEYSVGPLKEINGFSQYYKDMLVLNDTPNQRKQFESKMNEYLNKGVQMLKQKNIL